MAKNDITGDNLISRVLSKQGEENWDKIFGKKDEVKTDDNEKEDDDERKTSKTEV